MVENRIMDREKEVKEKVDMMGGKIKIILDNEMKDSFALHLLT